MYDWANSVYNLVISSSIFPIFYEAQTRMVYAEENQLNPDKIDPNLVTVDFFGMHVSPSVLYSLTLSFSFVLVTFLSPLLSGIADYTGSKKKFLRFFCYMGSISAMSLFFFDAHRIELGLISVLLASIGYWNSLVFYNAFLPEIAEPKDQDKVSARGFIMGYLGSMLLLLICLGIIMGIDKSYTRISFLLVGLWWIGFSQYTYRVLPNNVYNKTPEPGYIWRGFRELKVVFQEFRKTNRLKKYLRSFFFFNTGVQTVMLMAVYFAKKAIVWPTDAADSGLIIAILLIQLLGAAGAYSMSFVSTKIGNLKTLRIVVVGWILICIYAYFITLPYQFYILACSVGLVMGGVQAMARSTYSKFLPETTDTASYFSFYDVTEKLGIVLGTLFYGLMYQLTGNIRMSVVSIAAFFVIGFVLLLLVPREETGEVKGRYVDNE